MKYSNKMLLDEFEKESLIVFIDQTPIHKGIQKTKELLPKDLPNAYRDISRHDYVTLLLAVSEKAIEAYDYLTVPVKASIYWTLSKK